jgi:MFS family permease
VSTVAAARWGHVIGGVLSAFPLIVGPVLLVAAHRHGTAFAAQTAGATLLGLIATSGFVLAYARSVRHSGWRSSLPLAWLVAALLGALAGQVETGLLGGLVVATGSLAIALWALPTRHEPSTAVLVPRWELPLRMALTALLIVGISAAAGQLGPAVAGALAALPTVASVLAVSTHSRHGSEAVLDLLRGMLGGMTAFVMFCTLIGLLVEPAGVAAAFVLATAAAVIVQALSASLSPASALAPTRLPALKRVADEPEHRRPQANEQRAPLGVTPLVLVDGRGADRERDGGVETVARCAHGAAATDASSRRLGGAVPTGW